MSPARRKPLRQHLKKPRDSFQFPSASRSRLFLILPNSPETVERLEQETAYFACIGRYAARPSDIRAALVPVRRAVQRLREELLMIDADTLIVLSMLFPAAEVRDENLLLEISKRLEKLERAIRLTRRCQRADGRWPETARLEFAKSVKRILANDEWTTSPEPDGVFARVLRELFLAAREDINKRAFRRILAQAFE